MRVIMARGADQIPVWSWLLFFLIVQYRMYVREWCLSLRHFFLCTLFVLWSILKWSFIVRARLWAKSVGILTLAPLFEASHRSPCSWKRLTCKNICCPRHKPWFFLESLFYNCPPLHRNKFSPEFINRIDEFIIFEPLKKEQVREIVTLELQVGVLLAILGWIQVRLEMPSLSTCFPWYVRHWFSKDAYNFATFWKLILPSGHFWMFGQDPPTADLCCTFAALEGACGKSTPHGDGY